MYVHWKTCVQLAQVVHCNCSGQRQLNSWKFSNLFNYLHILQILFLGENVSKTFCAIFFLYVFKVCLFKLKIKVWNDVNNDLERFQNSFLKYRLLWDPQQVFEGEKTKEIKWICLTAKLKQLLMELFYYRNIIFCLSFT